MQGCLRHCGRHDHEKSMLVDPMHERVTYEVVHWSEWAESIRKVCAIVLVISLCIFEANLLVVRSMS